MVGEEPRALAAGPPLTPEQAFEVDRVAVERYGIPSLVLMENAGRAVAEEALRHGTDVGVVIGRGRNGGDGLVAARTLACRGARVRIYAPLGTDPGGDAGTNLRIARAMGLSIEEAMPGFHPVLVDAVFGIGLSRDVEGRAREAIERINRHREAGARVVAVDVPSGLDPRTGRPRGAAVRADVTVAMGFAKTGFLAPGATEYTGRVVVAEIGYPPGVLREVRG